MPIDHHDALRYNLVMRKFGRLSFRLSLGALSTGAFMHQTFALERPPQIVALAFDNCSENTRWEELKRFTTEMRSAGKPVSFTYFVSGVNFISDRDRLTYQGPNHPAGKSDIDFGGTSADIANRLRLMHDIYALGGEFGSHGVGHFHGGGWTASDWLRELRSFENLFRNAFANSGYSDAERMKSQLRGFRAPYLDTGPGLYSALETLNYRYDTSGDASATDWPRKKGKLWMFPLANLRINGSNKKTLSMDYNFFASQSGARDDATHAGLYQEQMLETYLSYFKTNYTGNRAPVNIGHHFFGYQGGAYNRALKDFARKVCGLPEVKCLSYSRLADFLDRVGPETFSAYQNGAFAKAPNPF